MNRDMWLIHYSTVGGKGSLVFRALNFSVIRSNPRLYHWLDLFSAVLKLNSSTCCKDPTGQPLASWNC